MATLDQKTKLFKAKIAVALHDELGRVPKKEEIEQVVLLALRRNDPGEWKGRVGVSVSWGFSVGLGDLPRPLWPRRHLGGEVSDLGAERESVLLRTSSAGFLSKNPDGTSLNPAVATGMIGHSSGRG